MASMILEHAELNDLEEIRHFVEHEVLVLGLNPSKVYDILLVITEAVTNSIVHGYQKQPGPIEIEVQADGDALVLTLRDDAPAFDPLQIPSPDFNTPLEQRRFGGMGIHLIREFTDEIVYNTTTWGGNEIRFIMQGVIKKLEKETQMQITVENVQGNVPLAVMGLHGKLDASNFESVIDKAKEIYAAGVQYLLLDMSELEFMSSSGLVAVHSIALLMRGEQPHNLETGWDVFRAIGRDQDVGVQIHLKLLNPQPKVALTLEKTGMDNFFEIHTDRQAAIDSF